MLWVPLGMAVTMVFVSLILGEPGFSLGFLAMGCGSAGAILLTKLPVQKEVRRVTTGDTMATVALAWIIAAILCAIPFWCSPWLANSSQNVEVFKSPINGLFEATSGITSTGLTMVKMPSQLPDSLQFWRTFMEWIGGVGIALLMITLINPRTDSGVLFGAELNKNFHEDSRKTARWIWQIYGALTLVSVLLFALLGMPWWESLNHGMTGIATGGFSITDQSFGDYSMRLQVAAILIMILGAISFAGYRIALQQRNPLVLLRRGPVLFLLCGIIVAAGMLWLSRLAFETDGGWYVALFQTVSAFATAGFSTVDLQDWHSAPLAVLVTCMIIGGASGATTGGVKTDRILLLCRGICWRIQRLFGSSENRSVTIDGQAYPMGKARLLVESAGTLVAIWFMTILLGCLVLAPVVGNDWSFTQLCFEVVSAIGSVGLTTGITTAELHPAGKWTLIVLMWVGRLELMAALALLWFSLACARGR